MNLVQDCRKNPTNPRDSCRTRSDGPYASRSLVKSETLRDISESTVFSRLPFFIWLWPPAVQKPILDSTSRGRFPKEFAINASSPHCTSICFRLSTRGWCSHSVVVETNIRAPRVVCNFLRSSRENGAGSIGLIAIPPETGYDVTFRFLKIFLNADSLAS